MKWVVLGMLLGFMVGCQHYSIPDHGIAVQVDTVALPPQWSAGEAELTRSLVQMLQSRGFESTWGAHSSDSPNRVNCVMDVEEWRAESVAFARATSMCTVGLKQVRAIGRSQGHQDVSYAIYEAGHDALVRALPEIEIALGAN